MIPGQGGTLSGFYRFGQGTGMLPDGTQFNVALAGAPAVGGYCSAYPNKPAAGTCGMFFGNATGAPTQR